MSMPSHASMTSHAGDARGERVEVDPRRAFRERRQAIERGRPPAGEDGQLAPGLLGPPQPRTRARPIGPPTNAEADGPDPYRDALRILVRPGRRRNGRSGVRLYHVLPGAARGDLDARCWAFTITRSAWDRLLTERVLDSDGATYPDGRPVVGAGVDPMDVPIVCGTCGTHSVECLQIEFWED